MVPPRSQSSTTRARHCGWWSSWLRSSGTCSASSRRPGQHHLTLSATELAYRPLHALLFAYWLAIGWVLAYEPMRRHGR
jgi:hypothetical protein